MDPRQNLLDYNRLLFRFLLIVTLIFFCLVALLWWQSESQNKVALPDPLGKRNFSSEAAMAEVTENYLYNARYIHDFEAYARLREVISSATTVQFDQMHLANSLEEVKEAKEKGTAVGNSHVYHTSYYIGNLLLTPEMTLHGLLTDNSLPKTAALLETALADIRAGTVKLQKYYDVAPAYWYLGGTSSPLFYPTPSFPSLTVSEATLVFYLLAHINPENARFYEEQARLFIYLVFTSGANFRADIEYSVKLAAAYFAVMLELPEYQGMLGEASQEWKKTGVNIKSKPIKVPYEFALPNFPIPTQFSVFTAAGSKYQVETHETTLLGQLRLSLVDTRLPEPNLRLYECDLSDKDKILPFALDLTPRQFTYLGSSNGYVEYLSSDKYLFISGGLSALGNGGYTMINERLFWRDKQVKPLDLEGELVLNSPLALSRDGSGFLYVKKAKDGLLKTYQATLKSEGGVDSVLVDQGYSPSYLDKDKVVLVKAGQVYVKELATNKLTEIVGIKMIDDDSFVRYFRDQQILLVVSTNEDLETLIPESRLQLYDLEMTNDGYAAELKSEVFYTDALVSSAVLSPDGNYLASALTEGLTGRQPRVLILDINNGIIKKDIDLSDFAPKPLRLDGWTLF